MPVNLDLAIAKQELKQKNLALVIAKNGSIIFETERHGISGLLDAIEHHRKAIKNASVADKVMGRAAALLLVYSDVVAAFAVTASDSGIQTLQDHNVYFEYDKCVQRIIDCEEKDFCPFEKLTTNISDPQKAYEVLKEYCAKKSSIRRRNIHLILEGKIDV